MIKKIFFTLMTFVTLSYSASAQLDISVNPLGILFGTYGVSVEKGISESFGVELTPDYTSFKFGEFKSTGFGVRAMGKYYFGPDKGLDKFCAAVYLRYGSSTFEDGADDVTSTRVAAGLYVGYKTVASSNLFFEVGLGAGKAFVDTYKIGGEEVVDIAAYGGLLSVDFTGKLAIGYRF